MAMNAGGGFKGIRSARWTTQRDEVVTVGDKVAIYSRIYPDAVGEIIGPLLGRIDFRVLESRGMKVDLRIFVDEDQLIMKIPDNESPACCERKPE